MLSDAERALLRQDEVDAKKWREENGSTYIVGSNQRTWHDSDVAAYVNSRLAAARAGERETLEKAAKAVCIEGCGASEPELTNVGYVHTRAMGMHGAELYRCKAAGIRKLIASLPSPPAESETKC